MNDFDVVVVVASCHEKKSVYHGRLGIVLAAGDYANSPDFIRRFKGAEYKVVDGINPHALGDGHRLAETAGAHLVNMDVTYGRELRFLPPQARASGLMHWLPTAGPLARLIGKLTPDVPRVVRNAVIKRLLVTWQHPGDRLFEQGAILINRLGDRFCDETQSPERELAVARQPQKQAFVLLDQTLIDLFSQWPNFVSTAPEIAYAYVADYLKLRPDVAMLSKSLAGDRWVLLGPLHAYFTTTEGGAAISAPCEVLDHDNRPIRGLYAVGQSGLGGQILWGHGLHIAWAITSGRLVAEHLATSSTSSTPGDTPPA